MAAPVKITDEHLAKMDERLKYEMARCSAQHDEAMSNLRAHGKRMAAEEEKLLARMEVLGKEIDPVFEGKGLTPERTRKALEYLRLAARRAKVSAARSVARENTSEGESLEKGARAG